MTNPIELLPINSKMDYDWLAGFTEGDGTFFINFIDSPKMKLERTLRSGVFTSVGHRPIEIKMYLILLLMISNVLRATSKLKMRGPITYQDRQRLLDY